MAASIPPVPPVPPYPGPKLKTSKPDQAEQAYPELVTDTQWRSGKVTIHRNMVLEPGHQSLKKWLRDMVCLRVEHAIYDDSFHYVGLHPDFHWQDKGSPHVAPDYDILVELVRFANRKHQQVVAVQRAQPVAADPQLAQMFQPDPWPTGGQIIGTGNSGLQWQSYPNSSSEAKLTVAPPPGLKITCTEQPTRRSVWCAKTQRHYTLQEE